MITVEICGYGSGILVAILCFHLVSMEPMAICISITTLQFGLGLTDGLNGIMSGSFLEIFGLGKLIV
jgi:hypothetical protein